MIKEIWIFIKDLLANKKTRAIAILTLWFFFFLFVYFFIDANKPNSNLYPETKLTGWDAFEKVESYHYQIAMEEVVDINYNQGFHITYDENQYEEDTLPSRLGNYHITFWKPSNLRKIVEKATLVSTNYLENKDVYMLQEAAYPDIPWENMDHVTIEVYKNNDKFYKIIIDQKDMPFHLEWEVKE